MSGFGVDPTQQQAPDPSQVFPHPSQLPAMQGQQQQEPGEPPEQPHDIPAETLDAETNILEAIEMGCEMCLSASDVSAEDFMRFAQGVQFLSIALSNLQPKPQTDPALAHLAGTAMRVDQQHSATMLKAEKDLADARARHAQAQMQDAQRAVQHVPQPNQQQAGQQPDQQQQGPQTSHPGQQPPSARG